MKCWILIRVARLLILSLAVLEVQFGKNFDRKRYLGKHAFTGHKIMVLTLPPVVNIQGVQGVQ